jgi:ATP-dependent Lon protease
LTRSAEIALFPLGIVLYPFESVPLHIFEPRYKRMIRDCRDAEGRFGIVLLSGRSMARVGCLADIEEVLREYSDGRLDIRVRGTKRFHVGEILKKGPYLVCTYELIDEVECSPATGQAERLITQHMKLLELAGRRVRPAMYQEVDCLSYLIARNAGLDLKQKQELLELVTEDDRVGFLIRHMETMIPRVEEAESFRQKIRSNGHFDEFPPEGGDSD